MVLVARMISEAGVWGKADLLDSPPEGLHRRVRCLRPHPCPSCTVTTGRAASPRPPGPGGTEHRRRRCVREGGEDVPRSAPSPEPGAACGASPHHGAQLVRAALREEPTQTIPVLPAGTGGHGSPGINVLPAQSKQVQDAFSVVIPDFCIEHYSL